ncbi:hypothetical protein [Acinetobacter variabilis]|uniref:hypothetical protein n=1 Tax=Acinetobacter variabilis TaxID=70346 RepID=UPI0028B043BE|nr:hypothetical protein [Acinetobacter variabilis]
MNNVVNFPGSHKEIVNNKTEKAKSPSVLLKIGKFLWLALMTALSPFLVMALHILNKVSSVSIIFSVIMMAAFYAKTGLSKPFFIGALYFLSAVLIKMLCNKKGR